ncbi:MAG: hypothetical protein ACTS43_01595 [Candidatus Hodgkinia cicadicola]
MLRIRSTKVRTKPFVHVKLIDRKLTHLGGAISLRTASHRVRYNINFLEGLRPSPHY